MARKALTYSGVKRKTKPSASGKVPTTATTFTRGGTKPMGAGASGSQFATSATGPSAAALLQSRRRYPVISPTYDS